MSEEITQDSLTNLIEDAKYLQDEAEALRYVIDSVPVTQTPPEDRSILEKLLLLDHLQVNYYRPVFERFESHPRKHVKAKNYQNFCQEFTTDNLDEIDVQKSLNSLAKHRAALINIFRQIPLFDWEQLLYKDNQEISLYEFALDLVRKDRLILKEIADQVLVFQQDQNAKREMEKNLPREDQSSSGNDKN